MNESTILVVEDDERTSRLVKSYLIREGYTVFTAGNGIDAIEIARKCNPTLVVLDLMLPGLTGREVCRILREEQNPLIIMLTARTAEDDKIAGLDSGADDYIGKPFSPRELTARIRAVLRRGVGSHTDEKGGGTISSGDVVLSVREQRVQVRGRSIEVTPVEYRILLLLMRHPDTVYSREQIIDHVFGYDYDGLDRTVDAHIKNLRRKIEIDRNAPHHIKTRFGSGYYFDSGNP